MDLAEQVFPDNMAWALRAEIRALRGSPLHVEVAGAHRVAAAWVWLPRVRMAAQAAEEGQRTRATPLDWGRLARDTAVAKQTAPVGTMPLLAVAVLLQRAQASRSIQSLVALEVPGLL